jgi:hypothetical protein
MQLLEIRNVLRLGYNVSRLSRSVKVKQSQNPRLRQTGMEVKVLQKDENHGVETFMRL